MKRFVSFVLFIPTVSVTLSCAPCLRGSQQKGDLGFVIPCEWLREEGICLLGKYKARIRVTLLEKGQSKMCVTKTGKSKKYEGESQTFSITKVYAADTCGMPDSYSVAFLRSRIWDYETLSLEELLDKDRIESFDAFVRSTTVLESLRRKAQDLVPGEISEIQNLLPKLYRYRIPEIDVLIGAYAERKDEHCCFGPRVIVINGTVYPLTGWCSYPFMRIFRLNGESYLESGSACCNCGITVKELFKVTPTGAYEVHSDGSFSN